MMRITNQHGNDFRYKYFISIVYIMLCLTQFQSQAAQGPLLLDPDTIESYVNQFNAEDRWFFQVSTDAEVSQVNNGVYGGQYVKNADLDQNGHSDAFDYLKDNIPLFDAPDADLVQTYYFRWWTYRKHIKNIGTEQNPSFVLTEFIDPVDWADPVTNTISCPSSHHIYEGRWIHQSQLMDDYERYWMTHANATPRRYSCWLADAIYARYKVNPDDGLVTELVADQTNLLNLETNYNGWVSGATQSAYRDTDDGLFWQIDDRDGMEVSYGGSGKRATLNSYMFGDTRAIAQMFRIAAEYDTENAATYLQKADLFDNTAESIKQAMLGYLWDPADEFFKVGYNDFPGGSLQGRRELHGFTPWYFNMPDDGGAVNYDLAWSHLGSFTTAYGFTSGAHDETGYNTGSVGSCCRWDGPIWPYATAITLKAMANLLRNYDQSYVDTDDYFNQLMIYSGSHEETYTIGGGPDTISCIDESMVSGGVDGGHWTQIGVPNTPRGFAYNHSTFCDLIISDLIGLQPRADGVVEVDPLVPQGQWAWFCLDNILYHGCILTIVWDQDGTKYGQGVGLRVYADGTLIASSSTLQKVQGALPGRGDTNLDGRIDLVDFAWLAAYWLETGCNASNDYCSEADIDRMGEVGLGDLEIMAGNWLEGVPRLVAHWKLDESSGTVAVDSTSNGHNGTLNGDPMWRPSGGKIGGALEFDGAGDYVEVEGYKGISGSSPRTVTAWVRTESNGSTLSIVRWGATEALGGLWSNVINAEGKLRAAVVGGSIAGDTDIADDTWHHVAIVLPDKVHVKVEDIRLYVDGEQESTTISYGTQAINTAVGMDVLISLDGCEGLLDDVRIYDYALSIREIRTLAGFSPELVAHWKLDELSGTVASDSVGSNDGTLNGNPTWWPDGGKIGGALEFDGDGDYVEIEGYKGISGWNPRTVTAWVRTESNGLTLSIVRWGTLGINGGLWSNVINAEGKLRAAVVGGSVVGDTDIDDDTWHHVAIVLPDKEDVKVEDILLYVDGGQEDTIISLGSQTIDTAVGMDVLISLDGSVGMLDDVRIYNYAMSEEEIGALAGVL